MFETLIASALIALALIGAGLLVVAWGIYQRLGPLADTIGDLRRLATSNQNELVQTKEGIGKMHGDLTTLVANSNRTTEIMRGSTRLPTR